MHIKIATIPGSSKDDTFEEQIDVTDVNWHMAIDTNFGHGPGGSAGAAEVHHLAFTHFVDASTPKLMIACCTGEHLADATFVASKSAGSNIPYLTIKLKDVMVASVTPSTSGSLMKETVQLACAEFEVTHQEHDNTGKKGPEVSHGFSVQKQVKTK